MTGFARKPGNSNSGRRDRAKGGGKDKYINTPAGANSIFKREV